LPSVWSELMDGVSGPRWTMKHRLSPPLVAALVSPPWAWLPWARSWPPSDALFRFGRCGSWFPRGVLPGRGSHGGAITIYFHKCSICLYNEAAVMLESKQAHGGLQAVYHMDPGYSTLALLAMQQTCGYLAPCHRHPPRACEAAPRGTCPASAPPETWASTAASATATSPCSSNTYYKLKVRPRRPLPPMQSHRIYIYI
jgi:hypothetical protein